MKTRADSILRVRFVVGAALLLGCGSSSGPVGASGGSGGASASGGSGGGVTSTGTGGASPSGHDCEVCNDDKHVFDSGTSCGTSLESCKGNATCAMWLTCRGNCSTNDNTVACNAACDQAASAVEALYAPIDTCICASCASSCPVLCH